MFIASLFTIAKMWKWPKCPSIDEWVKKWYIYTIENYTAIKEKWNITICNDMNKPKGYHTEWNKSDRERHIP